MMTLQKMRLIPNLTKSRRTEMILSIRMKKMATPEMMAVTLTPMIKMTVQILTRMIHIKKMIHIRKQILRFATCAWTFRICA